MLYKYVSIDGIPPTFVFFWFVDIIDITVHDRFWNVGQANCILKYFENMMIDHSDSTIFLKMANFTGKIHALVTKWQIILHFHCCFNNKYTPYFLG
jgi:hypothetical protein